MISAIILAGGKGKRMGAPVSKQFIEIKGKPIIYYTIKKFSENKKIDNIVVVLSKDEVGYFKENILEKYNLKVDNIVIGGTERQDSVYNGLKSLEDTNTDIVLIHDAIRPMVSAEIISDCIRVTQMYGNAITVIPCAEAMMQTEDGIVSTGSYPRNNLKRTQTPQGFPIGKICDLHRRALEVGITNSVASCTLMIEMGEQVYFSAGSEKNIKLTTVEDIDIFKALLIAKRSDWLK